MGKIWKDRLFEIIGKRPSPLINFCAVILALSIAITLMTIVYSYFSQGNPVYIYGEPFGMPPRPQIGIISHWYSLKLERKNNERPNVDRGRYNTKMTHNLYPISAIMGWHLTCESGKHHDRDIESIFMEPTNGMWTIYLEHTTDCNKIEVNVLFVSNKLASERSVAIDRPAPVGKLDDWPEITAELKEAPTLSEKTK